MKTIRRINRKQGRTQLLCACAVLSISLGGCQSLPQPAKVDFAETRPLPITMEPTTKTVSGSLFNSQTYRPAFEDRRARMVGDTVTIQIVESLAASQVSESKLNRTTGMGTDITPPLPGILSTDLLNLNMKSATNNDFDGKGGTTSANTFTGSITTTVVAVLPNGNLMVAGEKQIGVQQNVDVMRFTGTVDPHLLQPGSIISSIQVADVRVESRGRGAQADAQTVGWLSRFFLSFHPF